MNIPAQLRILFKNVEYTENSQNHNYEYFQNININKSGLCNVDLKKYLKNLIT